MKNTEDAPTHRTCRDACTAIVISTGTKFFVRFGAKNQTIQSWSLAGATMFGLWDMAEIEKIEKRLEAKGLFSERVEIKANIF
jgi:hypothetical protein